MGDVQGAGFDKDITVDAQQGADDEEGDEDVQEAVAVDPAVGDVGNALGQEVEVLEQTGSEEAEHCAAAEELVPDRQALADLTDQDAEGEQDGDRADHLVGDDVEVGAGQHDDGEKRIDGKRHSIELDGIQFFHCCFLRFTGQYQQPCRIVVGHLADLLGGEYLRHRLEVGGCSFRTSRVDGLPLSVEMTKCSGPMAFMAAMLSGMLIL